MTYDEWVAANRSNIPSTGWGQSSMPPGWVQNANGEWVRGSNSQPGVAGQGGSVSARPGNTSPDIPGAGAGLSPSSGLGAPDADALIRALGGTSGGATIQPAWGNAGSTGATAASQGQGGAQSAGTLQLGMASGGGRTLGNTQRTVGNPNLSGYNMLSQIAQNNPQYAQLLQQTLASMGVTPSYTFAGPYGTSTSSPFSGTSGGAAATPQSSYTAAVAPGRTTNPNQFQTARQAFSGFQMPGANMSTPFSTALQAKAQAAPPTGGSITGGMAAPGVAAPSVSTGFNPMDPYAVSRAQEADRNAAIQTLLNSQQAVGNSALAQGLEGQGAALLANPEAIDDATQRALEARAIDIAKAQAGDEQRLLSEQLGAAGRMGTGAGIGMLADYRRQAGSQLSNQLRDLMIQRAQAKKQDIINAMSAGQGALGQLANIGGTYAQQISKIYENTNRPGDELANNLKQMLLGIGGGY